MHWENWEKTSCGGLFDYHPIEHQKPLSVFGQKIIGSHIKVPTFPSILHSVNESVAKCALLNPGGGYLALHIISLKICEHIVLSSN